MNLTLVIKIILPTKQNFPMLAPFTWAQQIGDEHRAKKKKTTTKKRNHQRPNNSG